MQCFYIAVLCYNCIPPCKTDVLFFCGAVSVSVSHKDMVSAPQKCICATETLLFLRHRDIVCMRDTLTGGRGRWRFVGTPIPLEFIGPTQWHTPKIANPRCREVVAGVWLAPKHP